jgi:N-acetylglucosamine kinase-like BadF-type ATPase
VSGRIVLAVDGGNSKTDLALVREDGAVLALVRGGNSSPHHIGLDGTIALLEQLYAEALAQAGLDAGGRAAVGQLLLAGLDLPVEEERLHAAVAGRWAERLTVGNDTFAVLRAGTERGWGVAVVCGAGINCVGVGPDGGHVRFPALGAISGDWGGGYDVGLAALSAAVRSEDGRGPRTTLEQAVPGHFGLATPGELVEAIHLGRTPQRRIVELPPLVFDAADSDPVAAAILEHLASEVLALVRAAIQRLELDGAAVEVLLGGGMFRAGDGRLLGAIEAGVGAAVHVRVAASEPIVGAALLGLDELGAGPEALARARNELGEVAVHG